MFSIENIQNSLSRSNCHDFITEYKLKIFPLNQQDSRILMIINVALLKILVKGHVLGPCVGTLVIVDVGTLG